MIAAEVTVDPGDFGHLEPIVDAAQRELEQAGVSDTPAVLLADAGYWHKEQMENIIDRGIQVLIPPDAGKRKGTRPGWNGGAYAHLRRVLQTDLGRALYRRRQAMIEPVFGHTKFNRRIDRFQRRGRPAARAEWRLDTATHNLLKLHSRQIATAGACVSRSPPGPYRLHCGARHRAASRIDDRRGRRYLGRLDGPAGAGTLARLQEGPRVSSRSPAHLTTRDRPRSRPDTGRHWTPCRLWGFRTKMGCPTHSEGVWRMPAC